VTYDGITATFAPATQLEPGTEYAATVGTSARDTAGNALEDSKTWTFATAGESIDNEDIDDESIDDDDIDDDGTDDGTSGDTTAPTVTSTSPVNHATSVAVNSDMTARFSEAMDSVTISTTTFTLKRGTTPVSGAVTYTGTTATFEPAAALMPGTEYTATITDGVENLDGDSMAVDKVWTFTSDEPDAPSRDPVDLNSAGDYVILAKSGISTTGTTSIVGDLGVSPVAATYITGFGLAMHSSTQYSTSSLVSGKVYAADYSQPTPADLTAAISDMQTAYTNAANRTLPDATGLGAGNIGGMTLAPGLYKWGTGVTIPADLTLSGGADDVWIFQIAQTLKLGSGVHVTLAGGAQAENIFWQVAGQTTLGTTAQFKGNILCQTAIVLNTGAMLNGRALSQTAVTLDANTVTKAP